MKNRQVSDTDLIIKFPNKIAAKHFASWLSGSGEQEYWDWMSYRESEEKGNITAIHFHYHGEEDETKSCDDSRRYGKFMVDGIIRTTMGRLKND